MTIRAGQEWGRPAPGGVVATRAADDADLARRVAAGEQGPFTLGAGDLYRSLGSPRSNQTIVPIDALAVRIDDGPEVLAVAHVVARAGWWRGPLTAVCNVDYVGAWNVAPRAHPNDGRADVIEVAASMGVRARWQAWRRLPQGTHVPHPDVTTRSVRTVEFDWDTPMPVWLDGVKAGSAHHLSVTVHPDALDLLI